MVYRPFVLVVLDGWGVSNITQGNPIREAKLPTFEKLNRFYPLTTLQASGISVGLPWNVVGNSEVGHMTLGAGRVIYQNLPRIALSIQDGSFSRNPVLLAAIENVKSRGGRLHVMGLLSSGSVHSNRDHLDAILKAASDEGISETFVHIFTDGRDSSPTDGTVQIRELEKRMRLLGTGRIASLIGRNWAMDRNNNWDRIEKAYRMLTEGKGEHLTDPSLYLEQSYAKGITDEFIEPGVVCENDEPIGLVREGDSIIFFNYREDRAREITKAFTLPGFENFERPKFLDIHFVTMTEYERDLPVSGILFPPETVELSLGEVISEAGRKQLRIAETEKYAHVTYFFNGGKERAFPEEDRILIPSPIVSRFDEVPEMSSGEITETLIHAVSEGKYDFILVNYANPDMVAHTGNEQATIEAVQSVDRCLALVIPAILKAGGALMITADHGNAEELKKAATGETDTEHSINPVPLWYITPDNHREKDASVMVREQNEVRGLLSDVAPTILEVMGLPQPPEMNGSSLLSILK
ncbi:MAG: 2,3-bisphosphoglycerate-independent phosphoglycerate mutase [Candidatus Moranbacteria bacterium]|nr:2,3-bisphosphoglycerate-independent phosphoglycerate mutase [Candidatus Moranbacteria bacterium]NTW45960.1 2,3-bisphosphoglycerate-independent phosphoglycerate mutase [Candidatus Moranbacteria bacterium]